MKYIQAAFILGLVNCNYYGFAVRFREFLLQLS